jgi:hypothetical protein
VLKQAGLPPTPMEVVVTLPEGRRFVEASPTPVSITDGQVVFSLLLAENTTFVVSYR